MGLFYPRGYSERRIAGIRADSNVYCSMGIADKRNLAECLHLFSYMDTFASHKKS